MRTWCPERGRDGNVVLLGTLRHGTQCERTSVCPRARAARDAVFPFYSCIHNTSVGTNEEAHPLGIMGQSGPKSSFRAEFCLFFTTIGSFITSLSCNRSTGILVNNSCLHTSGRTVPPQGRVIRIGKNSLPWLTLLRSSLFPLPSSLHPSSFILHPSSFILHRSSFLQAPPTYSTRENENGCANLARMRRKVLRLRHLGRSSLGGVRHGSKQGNNSVGRHSVGNALRGVPGPAERHGGRSLQCYPNGSQNEPRRGVRQGLEGVLAGNTL